MYPPTSYLKKSNPPICYCVFVWCVSIPLSGVSIPVSGVYILASGLSIPVSGVHIPVSGCVFVYATGSLAEEANQ